MEIFMLCDLDRYELSAKGSMRGHEADRLGDAILRLPDDSVATIDPVLHHQFRWLGPNTGHRNGDEAGGSIRMWRR